MQNEVASHQLRLRGRYDLSMSFSCKNERLNAWRKEVKRSRKAKEPDYITVIQHVIILVEQLQDSSLKL